MLTSLFDIKRQLCDIARVDVRKSHIKGISNKPKAIEFIYRIKNKTARATLSLKSLSRSIRNYIRVIPPASIAKVTIVEDVSEDILNVPGLNIDNVEIQYYLLDTGIKWTRSGLLNYAIKRSDADLLAFVDADLGIALVIGCFAAQYLKPQSIRQARQKLPNIEDLKQD